MGPVDLPPPGGARARPARIVSGGQSGADRGALDAARATGVPIGGWCPAGGWAEDRPDPPGVRAEYPELVEASSAQPSERTRLNVRDSDATLVLCSGDVGDSPGSALTVATAAAMGRPCTVIDPASTDAPRELRGVLDALGEGCTLNVAGPRESEQPGIGALVERLLADALDP